MKSIIVGLFILILTVGVSAEPAQAETCQCECPNLRQHTWDTLKNAWAKSKNISREQWQEFLRWREQQREKGEEI